MTKDYGKGRGRKNRIAKAAKNEAYREALRLGLVLRVNETEHRSFTTQAALDLAIADLMAGGNLVEVIRQDEDTVWVGLVESDGAIRWSPK